MSDPVHPEIQELLGAYAIDAVDGDEAEAVDVHLRSCPSCRAEVSDHRETAAWLAHTGGAAPDGVWDRIASRLEGSPPPLRLAPQRPLRPARRPRGLLAVAAVVAIGVISVVGVRLASDGDGDNGGTLAQATAAAQRDPAARRIALRSGDQRLAADAVLLPDGTGYVVRSNLPPLAAGRTYQLWALVGQNRVSVGVPGPRLGPFAFRAAGDVSGLAVTEEREGGVTATENAPVLVGHLD